MSREKFLTVANFSAHNKKRAVCSNPECSKKCLYFQRTSHLAKRWLVRSIQSHSCLTRIRTEVAPFKRNFWYEAVKTRTASERKKQC